MPKMIICVVDDDFVYRTMSKRIFNELKFPKELLLFEDGEKAFNFIQENHDNIDVLPDFIFLDINMPYMDGWDFMDEYAKLTPPLPKNITIYMITSSILYSDQEKAKEYTDISDFLIKPVTKEQLIEIMEEAYEKLFSEN